MNILVINLTRFGDLLQTQPLILGFKARGHKVGLLCLDNFAAAAGLMDGLDHVAVLHGGALLAALDKDWRVALAAVDALRRGLETDFPPDMVCNTTASLSARLLARRLTPQGGSDTLSPPLLGFGMDAEGYGVSGDIWATFLQGASAERLNCPFNIVDMFRAAAGLSHDAPLRGLRGPDPAALERGAAMLEERAPRERKGFVAFQLGASEARRQWPVEHFAALGAALWRETGLVPMLLGSPAERPLAQAYAAATAAMDAPAPFADCVGATDVPQLAGLLPHARLLVSNDTGTMHLAAGLGVPVLGIFLATAQPWDTGPYLPGCCCLEPALDCHPCPFHSPCPRRSQCLKSISSDTAFTLARSFLETGRWPTPVPGDVRAWLTTTDAAGFADLISLSGHDGDERTVWLRMQRHFYRHIIDSLNGKESAPAPAPPALGLGDEFRRNVATALRRGEDLLGLLCEQAALSRRLPETAGKRLLDTCRRVHTVLADCRPLAALGHLWLVLSQERGGCLEDLLDMAARLRGHLALWRAALEADV